MRNGLIAMLTVLTIVAPYCAAERPPACEYSKLGCARGQRCDVCHLAIDGRSGRTEMEGWRIAYELHPINEIPAGLRSNAEFKRYVEPIITKTRTTSTLTGNRTGTRTDRPTGNDMTMLGVNSGVPVVANTGNTGVTLTQPVVTNNGTGLTFSGGSLFTSDQPWVVDGTGRNVTMPTNTGATQLNPIDGAAVQEVRYTLRQGDRFDDIVATLFQQELRNRGVNYRPEGQTLQTLVQLVRNHNAARWSFGDPVAGDVVAIPTAMFDQLAQLVRQQGAQNVATTQPVGTTTVQPVDLFGNGTPAVFNAQTNDGTVVPVGNQLPATYTPISGASNGQIGGAAIGELDQLQRTLNSIVGGNPGSKVVADAGTNTTDYKLDATTAQALRDVVMGLLNNGNTAVMSCPVGLGPEQDRLRGALDELTGTLAWDMHMFGLGHENAEKKADAVKAANEHYKELLAAIDAMRSKIRTWQG